MVRNPRLKWKNNVARDAKTGRYHARKMVNRKLVQRSFPTKRAATMFLEALVIDAVAAAYGLPMDDPAPTVAEAMEAYLEELRGLSRSPATLAYYEIRRKPLEAALGALELDRVTQRDVDDYVAGRKAQVGGGTINKELQTLRTIYHRAGITPTWRRAKQTHQVRRRAVQPVEVVRAIWPTLSRETQCAVGLCLLAGMRAAEAYRAEASWVAGEILTNLMHKSEGDTNRTYLVATLRDILPADGPLVAKPERAVQYELTKASAALKIVPLYNGPGAFRHHCSTYAVELGFTLEDVRLVLGHQQGGVTDRYIHSQRIQKKKSVLEAVEEFIFPTQEAVKASTISPQRRSKKGRK